MTNNPFMHDGAPNLDKKLIAEIFVDDFNHTRLIRSNRNVFLLGERGSGKSMALLYNSLGVQKHLGNDSNFIGVYVPCNTVLHHKNESVFFEKAHAIALSEHYLSLSMAQAIISTLKESFVSHKAFDEKDMVEYFSYVISADEIKYFGSFYDSLICYFDREASNSQRWVNESDSNSLYKNSFTFFTLIVPLIKTLKRIPGLENSHFMLLLDDAHCLNEHEKIILNSYIAYRDNKSFSFKVAIANDEEHTFITAQGGSILDGHDFTKIDLEQDFQSKDSSFGKMAKRILQKRLELSDIKVTDPDMFFPINTSFEKELEKYKLEARSQAELKYSSAKQISDYVYKYARVLYFRSRKEGGGPPPYSGFDTLSHVSTGVIRNLLIPCAAMYDDEVSSNRDGQVKCISPAIQRETLIKMSNSLWEQIEKGYSTIITNCTQEDSDMLKSFLQGLALLFSHRLRHHKSEPRVLAFTISSTKFEHIETIHRVLNIARKAQLIYTRIGAAKDDGKREMYYVPNRLLWICKGLDINGQHGRISLQASSIYDVMKGGKFPSTDSEASETQGLLPL